MAGLSSRLGVLFCGALAACSPTPKESAEPKPPRHVVGLHALEASEAGPQALAATRTQGGKHFLEVVQAEGGRWQVETTPLAAVWRAGFLSVTSDSTHVYALLLDAKSEKAEVRAYKLSDGQQVWRYELPAPPEEMNEIHTLGRMPLAAPLHVGHGRLLIFADSRVQVLDATNGSALWAIERLEATPRTAWIGKDFIAIDEDQALVVVDAQNGEGKSHYRVNGTTCRAGDTLLWAQPQGLRQLSLLDGQSSTVEGDKLLDWVEACGKVGDDWAIVGKRDGKVVAQRVAKDASLKWETELWGQGLAGFGLLGASAQGQGELGARWALAMYERQVRGFSRDRYVSLDLNDGKVKEQREGDGGLFRAEGVSLVGQPKRALSLVNDDGQVISSFESVGLDVTGGMARSGFLWVLLDRETDAQGAIRRVVIDLKTGKPVSEKFGKLPSSDQGVSAHFPKLL